MSDTKQTSPAEESSTTTIIEEARDLDLHERILRVADEIGGLAQTGQANFGGQYSFHKIDDIVGALRKPLCRWGITVTPSLVEHEIDVQRFTAEREDEVVEERALYICNATVAITIAAADDKDDAIVINMLGSGHDYGDKAVGKAISYAMKTALVFVFLLKGDGDIEADDHATSNGRRPAGNGVAYPKFEGDCSDFEIPFGKTKGTRLGDASAEDLNWLANVYSGSNKQINVLAKAELAKRAGGETAGISHDDRGPREVDDDIGF